MTMEKVIVIGHKNPDTDSIVSALAGVELLAKFFGKEAVAYRAGELNNETKFILEKFDVQAPELIDGLDDGQVSVALVDHNESGQTFDQLDYNNVDYVFDHHKISIKTEKQIFCRIEPIGSTASLIAKMFFEKNVPISEVNCKLLLAGILSDTLNLTSPTTTQEDRDLVGKLNEVAKIEIESFANEMFAAKSSLEGISISSIVTMDYKVFEMGSSKVGIGAWETTNPQSVDEKKEAIFTELVAKKEKEKLDHVFFMVVDIIKQNSQLYLIGDAERVLAEKVFGGQTEKDVMILPGVVSRKKQIVPQLTEELSK